MVCRVDERPGGRRHGWQLKPMGQGLPIGGGRLRSRGRRLVHCLNEAVQPNGTRLGWWLELAHLIFRSKTLVKAPCSTWVTAPSAETGRSHHVTENGGQRCPRHDSRKAAGESGLSGLSGCRPIGASVWARPRCPACGVVLAAVRRNPFPIAAKPSGNNRPLALASVKHPFSELFSEVLVSVLCRVLFTTQTDAPSGKLCW